MHLRLHLGFLVVLSATTPQLIDTATPTTTVSTTTDCGPMPVCAWWMGCDWYYDKRDCLQCACPNPTCQELSCPDGQECRLLDVPCNQKPCVKKATCVATTATTTATTRETTTLSSTPRITISCGPRRLECPETYGCSWYYDERHCLQCICPEQTCERITCPLGQQCQLFDDSTLPCDRYYRPCGKRAECVALTATPTTEIIPTTSNCLPEYECSKDCVRVTDEDGCPVCSCPMSCMTVKCSAGYECVMQEVECSPTTCFPRPVCTPIPTTPKECPLIKCAPYCFPDVGPDGCPACACPPTCDDKKCSEDEKCVLQKVTCKKEPCFDQPTCVPNDATSSPVTCPPPISCKEPCEPDFGSDGCFSVCACPKTCQDMKCAKNESCELETVYCFRAPCFPIPTCFPKEIDCEESPNENVCRKGYSLRWTYNKGDKNCRKFRYHGCKPSPNTFKTRKECEDQCSSPRRVKRLSCLACPQGCATAPRRVGLNQCPRCICPKNDPCKDFNCAEGECRLRVQCFAYPCDLEPYCAPIGAEKK